MANRNEKLRSHCPVNFALEAIGDRWSLLIIRDILLNGKQSFGALLESDEQIATNILSERLVRLVEMDIIWRQRDPHDGRKFVYDTTPKGDALLGVVLELGAWGAQYDPQTVAPQGTSAQYYADRTGTIEKARLSLVKRRGSAPGPIQV